MAVGIPIEEITTVEAPQFPAVIDYEKALEQLISGAEVEKYNRTDGSGLPSENSSEFGARYREVGVQLAEAVKRQTEGWVNQPEIKEFLKRFSTLDRHGQQQAAPKWSEFGVQILADSTRREVLAILRAAGFGSEETLNEDAGELSQVKGRLIEVLSRLSAGDHQVEDSSIGCSIMGGVPVGITVPLVECPGGWPVAGKSSVKKKGEPENLRWNMTVESKIPACKAGGDVELRRLVDAQVLEEINSGRVKRVNKTRAAAVTRTVGIWKNDRLKVKARLIANFKESEVNKRINLQTTVCLPRLRDTLDLGVRSSPGDFLAELDVKAAYRNIPVRSSEIPWLITTDPSSSNINNDQFLEDGYLPFGLISSPLIFCRLSGAVLRVMKRLFRLAFGKDLNSTVYVDDYSCALSSMTELVFLLTLALIMGIPIELSKLRVQDSDGRVQGWQLDLKNRVIKVPQEKVEIINELLSECSGATVASRTLESLVGKLSWCAQGAVQIKPHLKPLYALIAVIQRERWRGKRMTTISNNDSVRGAIEKLKGVLTVLKPYPVSHELDAVFTVVTDASVNGIGGVVSGPGGIRWFSINKEDDEGKWAELREFLQVEETSCSNICTLELLALYAGVRLVESGLTEVDPTPRITCLTDNNPTVFAVNKFSSKSTHMSKILVQLANWAGRLWAVHVEGKSNTTADMISRHGRKWVREKVPAHWVEVEAELALRTL